MNFAEIAADFVREHMDAKWTDTRHDLAVLLKDMYREGRLDVFDDASEPDPDAKGDAIRNGDYDECCGGGACHRASE